MSKYLYEYPIMGIFKFFQPAQVCVVGCGCHAMNLDGFKPPIKETVCSAIFCHWGTFLLKSLMLEILNNIGFLYIMNFCYINLNIFMNNILEML